MVFQRLKTCACEWYLRIHKSLYDARMIVNRTVELPHSWRAWQQLYHRWNYIMYITWLNLNNYNNFFQSKTNHYHDYYYPTERVGLLQHRYNQHRTKISLCSRHGISEIRLTCQRTTTTHLLCNIKVVSDAVTTNTALLILPLRWT
jgi:hypothetical protein